MITFESSTRLTINGSIQANATFANPITFTRSGTSGTWYGIRIENSTANSSFDYCTIEYSDNGIRLESTSGSITIDHCTMQNNSLGFVAQYSSPYTVRSSTITNNQYGLWIKSKATSNYSYIQDNTITGNTQYGVYMHLGAFAYFGDNHIYDNDANGLYCYSNVSPYLRGQNGHNWIYSNDQSGVKAQSNSWPKLGTNYQGYPNKDYYRYNHIYDNDAYEVENRNSGSSYIMAERNYWSASEENQVWPDNIYGLVDYNPILPEDPMLSSGGMGSTLYELELIEEFEKAIDGYYEQIAKEPDNADAAFAVGGLVRCYEGLERGAEIISLLNDLATKYLKTATERAAKDIGLPYLIQKGDFDTALQRTTELKEYYANDKERELLYTYILASIYEQRSEGKAGTDLDKAASYYQEIMEKFPESEFGFWAKFELEHIHGSSGLTKRSIGNMSVANDKPEIFSLLQNFPNPFNPSTSICYEIAKEAHVKIQIFNLHGELLRTLLDQTQESGIHQVTWNGRDENGRIVTSGIYFYCMQAGSYCLNRRLVLLK